MRVSQGFAWKPMFNSTNVSEKLETLSFPFSLRRSRTKVLGERLNEKRWSSHNSLSQSCAATGCARKARNTNSTAAFLYLPLDTDSSPKIPASQSQSRHRSSNLKLGDRDSQNRAEFTEYLDRFQNVFVEI